MCRRVRELDRGRKPSCYDGTPLSEAKSRELTIALLCALEGAFVLARALRTTEPLLIAGETVAQAVEIALAEAAA